VSSHREAPEIAQDPVADNADVFAFVSPDKPGTVTIISNFVPLQGPAGGPNFYSFGDDVLYSIYIDNDGDAQPEIEYQFSFSTSIRNPNTFLYNTGPITSIDSANWNNRQFYSVTRIDAGPAKGSPGQGGPAWGRGPQHSTVLGKNLACPPCNIGPASTPNYDTVLGPAAVHSLTTGESVFCGQRADPFYVDLGAVFDLADLRPFRNLHLVGKTLFSDPAPGVNGTNNLNIHTIAIQVPITNLTAKGSSSGVLGIWSGASRRKVRLLGDRKNGHAESGPWVQVSRLGNPLFNEVIVPLGQKDEWNAGNPVDDSEYLPHVQHPELAGLLPVLYPGVFPNLDALNKSGAARADLAAILLTGIPSGIIPGFQNFTGSTNADMLRLNVGIPPSSSPNILGVVGGDLAGFPNGRRVFDDIVAIELRAIAGVTYSLIKPSFTPDAAAGQLTDGLTPASVSTPYLNVFPYVGVPYDGWDHPSM
jgi:Domain of unknown function (DUF4331)